MSDEVQGAIASAEASLHSVETARAEQEARRVSGIDSVLQSWLNNQRNSPISQSTEAWNHLVAQLPALRAALVRET